MSRKPETEPLPELPPAHVKIVAEWVQLADSVGLPRSYAQIYGFLFISRRPITAQDCVEQLRISRSSAGQGLKALRELGAIKPHFELGSRAEAFTIEPDLGILIKSVLDGKVLPAFQTFFERMDELSKTLNDKTDQFEVKRIRKLGRWHSKLLSARRWLFP